MKLKVLDLFSGIGGFSLGLEMTGHYQTIAFCEQNAFCQKILAKHWPGVPIHDDIKRLSATDIVEPVDIITAGFPCQPASLAGRRRGTSDDRWLWPELLRVVQLIKPTWCLLENVYGLITLEQGMVFESLLLDLENEGYEIQTFVIPACAVDAPHRRDRVWIVAYADSNRLRIQPGRSGRESWQKEIFPKSNGEERTTPDAKGIGCRERGAWRSDTGSKRESEQALQTVANTPSQGWYTEGSTGKEVPKPEPEQRPTGCSRIVPNANSQQTGWTSESWGECSRWEPEPGVGRVAHGISRRVDRLRALGNAVVPQVVAQFGHMIWLAHQQSLNGGIHEPR